MDDSVRPNLTNAAMTLLRVVAGVVMTVHGWLKLTDISSWFDQVSALGMPAPEIIGWFAVAGELLGGLGLLFGALTEVAALGVASVMAAAIITVHLGNGLLAKNNGFEYPLTMMCVALVFMVRGAGPVSVDGFVRRMVHKRRAERAGEAGGAHPRGMGTS